MCQMSVVIDKEGTEELLFEDVTTLVVEDRGLRISTLFEGPKSVEQVAIDRIDFMAGRVFLKQT